MKDWIKKHWLICVIVAPGGLFVLAWFFFPKVREIFGRAVSFVIPVNATRGIRNNNPGNLRPEIGNNWVGQIGTDESGSTGEFCKFDTPENGLRAMGIIALNYQVNDGITNLTDFGNRWAPPSDNAGASDYGEQLASTLGVNPQGAFDLLIGDPFQLWEIMKAISINENGKALTVATYTDEIFKTGAAMAFAAKELQNPMTQTA